MKTKILFQSILFVIALVILNQFADAQTCSCRDKNKNYSSSVCDPNHLIAGRHHGCCVMVPCGAAKTGEEESGITGDLDVSIYPNPVYNTATVLFSLEQSDKVSIKVFDLNGKLVATLADKTFDAGDNEIAWNANEVNAGIYLMQFQSTQLSMMEKFVITK
jgi:hypothetical protein